jgi:hypothetical protein
MDMTFADLIQMHIEEFGVEPVITGINYHQSDEIADRIIAAINIGQPYVEQDVPEDVKI